MKDIMLKINRLLAGLILFSLALISAAPLKNALAQSPQPRPLAWELSVQVNPDEAPVLQMSASAIKQSFAASGVQADLTGSQLVLKGSDSLEAMRSALFDQDIPGVDFLGGLVNMDVSLPADGSIVTLNLEGRISAGYVWEVQPTAEISASQVGPVETVSRYWGMGAPAVQTIRLQMNGASGATAHLVYHRPFEPQEGPHASFKLSVPTGTSQIDLTDPTPAQPAAGALVAESAIDDNSGAAAPLAGALPSSWDWRSQKVLPGVRDQGSCGGCWAFGTVGVFEAALKKAGGPLTNLSEQFLISCNTDGWSCNGGLTGSKYHYNILGRNQSEIGAVLETVMPYRESNGACSVAVPHPYKLAGWSYVDGREWTVPSPDKIKNAIYTYGPVAAAVCAGNAFSRYSGGVFSTNENVCGGHSNHLIILVGWDDATGSWILRNSWGSAWGESGYMRIKYGTSRVGESASWVSLAPPAEIPNPIAPAGAITRARPTFQWSKTSSAAQYEVQVLQGGSVVQSRTAPASICTAAGCSDTLPDALAPGDYSWQVRAQSGSTWGGFSNSLSFSVVSMTPVASDPSGATTDATPTYRWSKIPGAVNYEYQVHKDGARVAVETVAASVCGVTSCEKAPAQPLAFGQYQWQVRAYDGSVWGDFSPAKVFSVVPPPPPVPVAQAPTGVSTNNTPAYRWSLSSGAASYDYRLYRGSTLQYSKTVAASACGAAICQDTPPDKLAPGAYKWQVRAVNITGASDYSAAAEFTIAVSAPVPAAPAGVFTDKTPTYQWSKVEGAAHYEYRLYQGSAMRYMRTVAASACGPAACQDTPVTSLAFGEYQWKVRASDGTTWSDFSASSSFSLISAIPTPSAPSGLISDTAPTYQWSEIPGAVKYEYRLYQGSKLKFTLAVDASVCAASLCQAVTPEPLSYADYQWQARSFDGTSWSAFSPAMKFTAAYPVPAPVSPTGASTLTSPAFTWNWVEGAALYEYQVYKGSSRVFRKTVGASACVEASCVDSLPDAMAYGAYRWQVRASDGSAWGPYSPFIPFSVDPPVPNTLAPTGIDTDSTPTYQWSTIPGAAFYQYRVYQGKALKYSKIVPASACDAYSCMATPIETLAPGEYQWMVRFSSTGAWTTPFSPAKTFTVASGIGFDSQFNGSTLYWSKKAGAAWSVNRSVLYTTGLWNKWTSMVYIGGRYADLDYSVRMLRTGGAKDGVFSASYLTLRQGSAPKTAADLLPHPGYAFGYTNDGYYSVWKRNSDGSSTAIQPWTFSSAIVKDDWNTLQVKAVGGDFFFYINGSLVVAFSDSSYSFGAVGFDMYSSYGVSTRLQVDWATLSVPPAGTAILDQASADQTALNQAAVQAGQPGLPSEHTIEK